MTSPCASPTWSFRAGRDWLPPSESRERALMRSSESCISSDARTASDGCEKIAIRPSPSVLTTLPPQLSITLASSATLCVTTAVASALPSVSYSAVLPRRSANRTVRSMICVMGASLSPREIGHKLSKYPANQRLSRYVLSLWLRRKLRCSFAAARSRERRTRPTLQVVQIRAQLVRAARVLELADRLGLDLANTLACHVELLADFF